MAKAPVLPNINATYFSAAQLNAAFESIEDAFENTLSLDGSTPNSMGADLDLNGHDVLNAGLIAADDITIDGTNVSGVLERAETAVEEAEAAADRAELSANYARPLESFGTITGTILATDMATWNAALTWAKANRGTIVAPPGKSSLISDLRIKSFARVLAHGHTFRVSGSIGMGQDATSQVVRFGFEGGRFIPHTVGDISATVWDVRVIQLCKIQWEQIGFTTGTGFRIRTDTLTIFDEADFPIGSSNAIYNDIRGWADEVAVGLDISGHYGTTPTVSPANSSPMPAGVVTKNKFRFEAWNFTGTLCHIRRCCDSDDFDLDGYASATGATFVRLGNGSVDTYTGNNYVNSHNIHLVAAVAAGVTACTLTYADSWTFGHRFEVEHDINFTVVTVTEAGLNGAVTKFSYRWTGKGADSSTGNTAVFYRGEEDYNQAGDGLATRPSYSFDNERGLGFFREASGRLSLSHAGARTYFWTSGQFGVPSGNATAPSITFAGDTGLDTGIYAHNIDEIGFSSSGTTKFIINSLGAALPGLPNYANDAAAAAGGIPVSGLYRNGNIIQIRVV